MIRLLIIDDEEAFLELASEFLEREEDIELETCDDPEAATGLIYELDPDVIVCDYQMPAKNGLDILRELRDEGTDIPFLFFTGRGREEVAMEALNSGADFYLQKGGDARSQFGELLHVVRRMARARKQGKTKTRLEMEREKILSSLSELVAFEDPYLRIIWANKAAASSVNKELDDIIGKHCWEVWGDDQGPCPDCPTLEALKRGEFKQSRRHTSDGRSWFIRANPVKENGSVVGVVEVGLEITDLEKAYQRLNEEQERYRELFENTGVATMLLDHEGHVVMVNERFKEISGYSEEELLDRTHMLDLVPDGLRGPTQELRNRQLSGSDELPVRMQVPFKRRDGEIIYIESTTSRVPGTDRLIISLFDLGIDKDTVERLTRSEEKYRNLFDNTGTVVAVVDEGGTFSIVNGGFQDILGYNKQEVEGRMTWMDLLPPSERERLTEEAGCLLDQLESGSIHWEQQVVAKDGRVMNFVFTGSRLPGGEQFIGSGMDITGMRNAERSLQELQSRYQELVDNANSIIMRFDPEGRITFLNEFAQRFFGYKEEEILDRKAVGTIVPTVSRDGVDRASMIEEILKNPGEKDTYEAENIRSDGERVWVAWTNRPIRDEEGNLTGVLFVGSDVSEKREAERNLEMTRKKLDLMSAVTRHDIMNQLAIIGGYGTLLEEEIEEGTTLSHLRKMKEGISRVSEMVSFQREYELIGQGELE
jgi:PAS domain S-box-containing protein